MAKKKLSIYYITPYSEDSFKVEKTVNEAFEKLSFLMPDYDFNLQTFKSLDESDSSQATLTSISAADVVICNITKYNSNVMYELGFAHALNKPTVVIIDNDSSVGFDIASTRYLVYDINSLSTNFVHHLAKVLTHVVAQPDDWMPQKRKKNKDLEDNKKTVFVSYSHKDFAYLERVKIHLKPLEKNGLIDLWSDTLILSGEKWKEKIENALDKAAIALLLISADFMASDFIVDKELQPLLKSAEQKGTIIIPVIVKPCRFLREPSLSQFQSANDPINPLCKLNEFEQEEVYEKVSHRIEVALGSE